MANQYTGSFEHIVRQRFNCSAKEVLQRCSSEDMTYQDAEQFLGFKHGTIRKWSNRYGIRLRSGIVEQPAKRDSFSKMFKQKSINKYNVLSRCWLSKRIYSY
ncbi:MAG: hypothetical protein ACO2ZM_04170 [Francisellaceae bacterium]